MAFSLSRNTLPYVSLAACHCACVLAALLAYSWATCRCKPVPTIPVEAVPGNHFPLVCVSQYMDPGPTAVSIQFKNAVPSRTTLGSSRLNRLVRAGAGLACCNLRVHSSVRPGIAGLGRCAFGYFARANRDRIIGHRGYGIGIALLRGDYLLEAIVCRSAT